MGTGSTGLARQPRLINTLHCFGRFSLIRARNWVPFFFLDSLFYEESYGKVLEFFSIGWTGWEPVQLVLLGSPSFSMLWLPFLLWLEPLGSKALVDLRFNPRGSCLVDRSGQKSVFEASQCGSAEEVLCLRSWSDDGWLSFWVAIFLIAHPHIDISHC